MSTDKQLRIRKPWYNNNRQAWYVDAANKSGKRIKVRLAADRDEAFRTWERDFKPAEVARKKAMLQARRERQKASVLKTVSKPVFQQDVSGKASRGINADRSRQSILSREPVRETEHLSPVESSNEGLGNRLRQLNRLLVVIELLSPLRNGARIEELRADLNDTLGTTYSDRTVRRDLDMLVDFGVVRKAEARYVWLPTSVRSAMTRQFAEVIACRREGLPLTG